MNGGGHSYSCVTLKKFNEEDIDNKIEWINNPLNNKFLYYDLPLEKDKTLNWFRNNKERTDRYDAVIEFEGKPVGLIGLLSIDNKNRKAEYYISMGDRNYLRKGIAYLASIKLLEYGFNVIGLNKIYLTVDQSNVAAQNLYSKIGFEKIGLLKDDIFYNDRFVSRYYYSILKKDF